MDTLFRNKRFFFILSLVFLVLVFCVALAVGRYVINLENFFKALFRPGLLENPMPQVILWKIRLPRIIMAVSIGAGLAVSGAALQALFGNPLVSEHILGVSSGAGFGAALGILSFSSVAGIQISAIVFGIASVSLTWRIGKKDGTVRVLMLVLSGVIVSSLFRAGISLLQYIADAEKELPAIVFWLMGSLAGVTVDTLVKSLPLIFVPMYFLHKIRWQLNLLSLHEEEAISMGVDVKKMRMIVILLVTVITATVVSACGIITFVGLVIPHFSRMFIGTDNKTLIPASMIIGAIFLIVVDTLARSLTAAEIPLSVLTSIFGAPFFAYMLHKTGGVWND